VHITLALKIIGDDPRVVTVKNENLKCTLHINDPKIMGLIKGKLHRNVTTSSMVCIFFWQTNIRKISNIIVTTEFLFNSAMYQFLVSKP